MKRLLASLIVVLLLPSAGRSDDPPVVGVWQRVRSVRGVEIVERWTISTEVSGKWDVRLRFTSRNEMLAAYTTREAEWDAEDEELRVVFDRAKGGKKWAENLAFKTKVTRDQLVTTAPRRAPVRGGRLDRIADPGKELLGNWVVTNGSFKEAWDISRTDAGEWSIRIRYFDGDRESGASHADSFEFRGDWLYFRTVMDRRPTPGWKTHKTTLHPVGESLKQSWIGPRGGRGEKELLRVQPSTN